MCIRDSSGPRFVVGDQDQFRGLLARIVENTIRDRARWHGAARRAAARERDLGGASIDLSASRPGPATELAGRERAELLRLAVELLGEHDRDVVRLHQLEGRPMSEVAELLGLHASTAHMRYRRALPRLALVMQELLRGEWSQERGADWTRCMTGTEPGREAAAAELFRAFVDRVAAGGEFDLDELWPVVTLEFRLSSKLNFPSESAPSFSPEAKVRDTESV